MYDLTRSLAMFADKKLIRLRFEQAAATYEEQAAVQQQVADHLLDLLFRSAPGLAPLRLLEIGCCTGLLTQKLLSRLSGVAHLTLSDLVAAFERCVLQKVGNQADQITFLAGDIEGAELAGPYDLIISSSTLHWVHDLHSLVEKLQKHCAPEGILAVSLYGQDNLHEIRAITGLGLPYRSLEELQELLATRFEILHAEQSHETLWYAEPMAVLQHLRATGVNAVGQKTWSRQQIRAFAAEYVGRFATSRGVSLTYHPLYIIARPR